MIFLLIAALLGFVSSPIIQEDNVIYNNSIQDKETFDFNVGNDYVAHYYSSSDLFNSVTFWNWRDALPIDQYVGSSQNWFDYPSTTRGCYFNLSENMLGNYCDQVLNINYGTTNIPSTSKVFNRIEFNCYASQLYNNYYVNTIDLKLVNYVPPASFTTIHTYTYIYLTTMNNGVVDNALVYQYGSVPNNDYLVYTFTHPRQINVLYDIVSRVNTQEADSIRQEGYNNGYNIGYLEGYNQAIDELDYDATALTIFTGILDIALIPVNVFLEILNFEVFGINISGFVSALLTISIIIIIIRFLFGGKSSDK